MSSTHILGFPRIGAQRELKFAQEAFWRGEISEAQLLETGKQLRAKHWDLQSKAGLDFVSVGDFAWYDQVLSTLALLGALPSRFGFQADQLSLSNYFTAARGSEQHFAMEMTKWFDTNYHYLVPEWNSNSSFNANGGTQHLFEEIAEAKALGHNCKAVLIGPLTLLYLGKIKNDHNGKLSHKLDLLHKLIPAYQALLSKLKEQGITWVQIDEPILGLELDQQWLKAFEPSYSALSNNAPKILLSTYFESIVSDINSDINIEANANNEQCAFIHKLPVAGVHVDLVRAPEQLQTLLKNWPKDRVLSAGIIDGRNIWRANLSKLATQLSAAKQQLGDRLWISASCSLLHVPVDLANENTLDVEIKSWLAYATQKLDEIVCINAMLNGKSDSVQRQIAASNQAAESRLTSTRIHNPFVQKRLASIKESDTQRHSAFKERIIQQQARFNLPKFPTTTIGSFPQTKEIRLHRAQYKRGELSHIEYLEAMRTEIKHVVEQQEALDIDVLVHGEAERNDMVEYFGEQLWGYGFSANGWVQSYGSRCVKPPFIYGDVYRPEAMTVSWSSYAQSLTTRPMKGMLTGPVTMLQWSFVRDDQPRQLTAQQIALALRDEVVDLEKAGIGIIQIDEPAFREGLPLKERNWVSYLNWAVEVFQLCAAGVKDDTQIHTHMCYSEFNDILPWIAAMDADVITIETSRSDMELLDGFGEFSYPNDIGPGVYDIHSPREPQVAEIERLLIKARNVIPDSRLWVNPDCGLKTRGWPETIVALQRMVAAAKALREKAYEVA